MIMMRHDTLSKAAETRTSGTISQAMAIIQRWGILIAAVTLSLMALLTPAGAGAQTRVGAYNDARSGAIMTLAINKSQTLRTERAVRKAVVGNPDIADVLPVSASSVYILGKAIGSTNVSLFDPSGNLVAVVDVVVTPDSQGLKRTLAELMPTEAVGVSVSNESVVLAGTVSSAAAAERAATIAETFAPKKVINMMSVGTAQQVLLEVRFSEMQRGTVKQLGINNVSWNNLPGGSAGDISTTSRDVINNPYSIGVFIPGAGNLNIELDALEREGMIRTLAQPNLIALSGETASFLAGGEFPIITNSQLGQVAIEFKQFGVSLAFSPTVLEDGLINILVAPEVSSLDPEAGVVINGFRIPGLKVRRARTMVELRDGQSFALAGLIQSDFSDTVRAIPLLGQIPIIGALFRSSAYNRQETELVIIVTPRLIRPFSSGTKLPLPTDRVQQPSDADFFLLGRTAKVAPVVPPTPRAPVGPTSSLQPGIAQPGGIEGDYGHIVR
jgi:pilus assembly protein CpaC